MAHTGEVRALHFYGGTIAVVFGIVVQAQTSISILFVGGLLATALFIVLFYREASVVALCLCCMSVGVARGLWVAAQQVHTLDVFVEQQIELEGLISSEPDVREKVIHYVFKPHDFDVLIRVTARQYPQFYYGDTVRIKGSVSLPKNFQNEHGLTFDYVSFLQKDGIRYVSFFPQITILERQTGNWFLQYLFTYKQWFIETLQYRLKEPHGSLAAGILIGAKQSLGVYYLDAFRKSGLIHIVVLSGYNVTIIADTIRRAFSFLPRSIGAMTSVSAIITFALFTGGGATTVRASIMAIIGILAIQYARRYSVHRSLLLAAVVMALHNPYIVLGDPGFQLSFVATLGLLYISPLIEKMLGWVPGVFQLRSILATTTATQMSVLPLLVIMTGEVSVVSLLANALVLPIVAPAMALSALTAFLSWMGAVALPLYVVTHYALAYMLFISEYFGTMSHATIPLLY